jgi:exosome complex component MTR3
MYVLCLCVATLIPLYSRPLSSNLLLTMLNVSVTCNCLASLFNSRHGPRQNANADFSEKGQFECEFSYASFAGDERRKRFRTTDEMHFANVIQEAISASICLHKYPKSVVEAHVMVIEEGPGVLGAAITCTSLALADAGIELYDLVASCSAAYVDGVGIILDPTASDEALLKSVVEPVVESDTDKKSKDADTDADADADSAASKMIVDDGRVSVAYMPSLRQLTHLSQTGHVSASMLHTMMERACDGASQSYQAMRTCLLNSVQQQHGSS